MVDFNSSGLSQGNRSIWKIKIKYLGEGRVALEVDQPSGYTKLLEVDQATRSDYLCASNTCQSCPATKLARFIVEIPR